MINWREILSEIDSRGQRAQEFAVRVIEEIAMIGKIWDPSVGKGDSLGKARAPRPLFPMNFPSHAGCVTKKLN